MIKVWVNGTFDIVHLGHIQLLKKAADIGDFLIVGLDGDKRVKELKGEQRPINNLISRITLLESIRYVDRVVAFDSDDLPQMLGRSTKELAASLGAEYERELVHRDDLVLI
jgi:D-beta-D-heptose 7-phosphate kinase/D-beta-D-heptose 1-phosphate adenosyltransferase